jgi:periplasmic protein CpxP/Spy
MTTPTASPPPRPIRRALISRHTLVAFVAGAATLAVGLGMTAWGAGMGSCHHGMMMDGSANEADVAAHVEHVLKHFYSEVDATPDQRAQIDPLVKQAVDDLKPLQAQLRTAHAQMLQALTGPTVDRSSLEAARAAHLQLADQASKRFVQLVGDVDQVLTVQQRQAFAEHLRKMHGG